MGKVVADPMEEARERISGRLEEAATDPDRQDADELMLLVDMIFRQKIPRGDFMWQLVIDVCRELGIPGKERDRLRDEIFL